MSAAGAAAAAPGGLLLLAARLWQMGHHSGYHLLAEALPAHWPGRTEVIQRRLSTPFPRVLHKLTIPFLRRQKAPPTYNYLGLLLEWQALRRMARGDIALTHMLFVENDLHLLARRPLRGCLVGSVHKPSEWWLTAYPNLANFRAFDGVVAMAREQIPFLQEHCPRALIEFHRLGVDLDFFKPAEEGGPPPGAPHFISVGDHIRDFETLSAVIESALARIPDCHFDLVMTGFIKREPAMQKWIGHPRVAWHSGISSERMRELYRGATAQVLMLKGTAANNAAIETAACGVPLIGTDLPGLHDYATEEFADFVPARSVEDCLAAMQRLLDDPARQRRRAAAARAYAEQHFNWARLADEMVQFYLRVIEHARRRG